MMTVHLTMRSKCTCNSNNNTNANTNQGFRSSTLFSNYINSSNNLNQRNVTIILLDSKCLDFSFDNKTTVYELFEKVCNKLQLKEFDVFGLAQRTNDTNEYYFLPNNEKLHKHATKCLNNNISNITTSSNVKLTSTSSLLSFHSSSSSFSSNNSQINSNSNNHNHTNSELETSQTSNHSDDSLKDVKGSSCFKLYFRVQFFLTDPLLLRDADTRQLYYYQLKENFLNINHSISQERYFELAALALQADYGNFNHEIHKGSYFDIDKYFPKWIINKLGENFIMKNIPSLHAEQSRFNNNTQKSAQLKYCSQLSNDEYPYNLHFYNVFKTKDELIPSISLGIAPNGILVFEIRSEHDISLISTFPWSSVTKLNFDKKKFEITISIDSNSRKYSYYTNCEKRSKYLFELSKITHSFTVNIFSRLVDQKTLANYVTESYKETMCNMINGYKHEIYQEREICAPNNMTEAELQNNNDSSSRETRPTRKRLATYDNENSEQLLRKYSSLSGKKNNYFQSQKSPKSQTRNLVEFEPCLSISSTNLLINQTIQNSSPSTTSSSSVSSVSVTSLPQQQQNKIVIDSGVPMKMIKSSVPSVNLHTVQSCYAPSNNNKNQYYYQQNHVLLPTNAYQNGTNLEYRQTFTAFSSINKPTKQQAPPPPPYHTRTKDLSNRDNYENYENKHKKNPSVSTPPYVEYKKPPSYEESVHRIKHSKDSSISSTCTSPERMELDENTINSNNSNTVKIHDFNKQYEKNKKHNKLDSDEDMEFEQINHSINRITIDEKNLEQIRIKAASMSLPLLTALCSDISLIRSLSKRDETNKQVS